MLTTALVTFHATAADIQRARELYQRTEYAAALKILQTDKTPTAEVWALAGKTRFMLGDHKDAIDNLQKAVELEPANADYVPSLARAWGRKAEHSNPFTAMSAAWRTMNIPERAWPWKPHSPEATGDLFDYYLEAPGFAGGGLDKAEALAHRVEAFDPSEGRFDLARIAARRKKFTEAEQGFRDALRADPRATPPDTPSGSPAFSPSRDARRNRTRFWLKPRIRAALGCSSGARRLMWSRIAISMKPGGCSTAILDSSLTPDDPSREEARKLLHRAGGVRAAGSRRAVWLVVFVTLLKPVSNLFLAWGMKHFPSAVSFEPLFYLNAVLDPLVIGGIVMQILWLLARMSLLSVADLSYVLPVTAAGYGITTLLGRVVLHEQVSVARWAGAILISLGTWFATSTSQKTTAAKSPSGSDQ